MILTLVFLVSMITGCGSAVSPGAGNYSNRPWLAPINPQVLQDGTPPNWVYFQISSPSSNTPTGITVGPDGKIWFAESNGHRLVRMDMHGGLTNHLLPAAAQPQSIAVGADSKFYMTDTGTDSILVVTTAGAVSQYSVSDSDLQGITRGPDGSVWFATLQNVGKITTSGVVTL